MKKKEKCYQILTSDVVINGLPITKSTIVYYDEIGIEETRENYDNNTIIKEGYIPIYLTVEVTGIYNTVSNEIKDLYLETISVDGNLNEDETLTINGRDTFKNKIRTLYSQKISQIDGMRESVERYSLDGTPIPQSIIDERETLKTEYHNLVTYLGL